MYKGIIFDLDGTLLNTLGDLTNAVNHVCNKYNIERKTLKEIKSFVGNGIRNLMSLVVPNGENNPLFEEMLDEFRSYYSKNVNVMTHPYKNVLETMKLFKENGIKMIIVSNKKHELLQVLKNAFFQEYVEFAIGEDKDKGFLKKPDPSMVNKAVEFLGFSKKEILYVGDSSVDKKTADNAFLDCCLVTYGFRSKKELELLNSRFIIDDLKDLIDIVLIENNK